MGAITKEQLVQERARIIAEIELIHAEMHKRRTELLELVGHYNKSLEDVKLIDQHMATLQPEPAVAVKPVSILDRLRQQNSAEQASVVEMPVKQGEVIADKFAPVNFATHAELLNAEEEMRQRGIQMPFSLRDMNISNEPSKIAQTALDGLKAVDKLRQ